ncbi:TIGR03643 family protein [Undibacterium amnicola]|uniref:TIGR03643 family protein n=1 Tax=Undibacterium amnicola TaxID=1834038 RepID=A0ABR6XMF3_9BURK|nr:TIGR03643 family protein [Undibacterium amnicola]MBC3830092.1 TIGR03643 family protein [Undibacterium amnicola]
MQQIDQATIDRVIQMAWEDRTSFDAIQRQFGLDESAVIRLMRSAMKASSFKMWRTRVTGRKTKHQALRGAEVKRFKSNDQKNRDF